MSQTTYYEFNKPIGTDLVNPLVDQIPNWDIADIALHELNTRSVANASEVISLGVHAITRLNTYTKFIKWIATGNFTAGDTFTVDGNVVAASTPSGETLATNAYVTGTVILACLNADDSAMTIYVTGTNVAKDSEKLGGEIPAYYATQADMTNAQTDIGNIKALNGTTSIASIGDGTITGAIKEINDDVTGIVAVSIPAGTYASYAMALQSIAATFNALSDEKKRKCVIVLDSGTTRTYYQCIRSDGNFSNIRMNQYAIDCAGIIINTNVSSCVYVVGSVGGSITDRSALSQDLAIELIV